MIESLEGSDKKIYHLDRSDHVWLGITGASVGLMSYLPFIFISWWISDIFPVVRVDNGIDPPEELILSIPCALPLVLLCSFLGITFSKQFFSISFKINVNRYLAALIGAILGGFLGSILTSLIIAIISFYR